MMITTTRIRRITEDDVRVRGKSNLQLFASLLEELGETARAAKVWSGVERHKALAEPLYSEAADLYICAVMIWSLFSKEKVIEITGESNKAFAEDVFEALSAAARHAGMIGEELYLRTKIRGIPLGGVPPWCGALVRDALDIYYLSGGQEDQFDRIVNEKLDKYERANAGKNHEHTKTTS